MAFSLYCLITDKSSELDLAFLEKGMRQYFSETDDFSIEYEEDPFDSSNKNLILSWGGWWIRIFYEVGYSVAQDSEEIAKYLESSVVPLVSGVDRRIRVLFADDEDLSYTNHIIFMTDYLESRPDLIIFDPQRKSIFLSN